MENETSREETEQVVRVTVVNDLPEVLEILCNDGGRAILGRMRSVVGEGR